MSLTDKRIEEILKEVEPHAVRLPLGWKLFARAIEAEATKPCTCGDSSAQGVFHRTDGPCYLQEATKPQEPVATVVSAYGDPEAFGERRLALNADIQKMPYGTNFYTTPQPCQLCAEKQSAIDVWEGRYADLSAKCAERIAELEAECAAMRENSKRWHGLFDTAVASLERSENNAVIKEIEAERDALAMQNQQMREAIESIYDGPDPLASYHHGIRCGVEDQMIEDKYEAAEYGYDDALQYCAHIAKQALSLPDTSEIIKRHDAAVLRKAAEHLEGYEYVFNAPPINYAEAHELRLMANELEKSCQP